MSETGVSKVGFFGGFLLGSPIAVFSLHLHIIFPQCVPVS